MIFYYHHFKIFNHELHEWNELKKLPAITI